MKKTLTKSITLFLFSLMTLATSMFAWFTLSEQANIGTIESSVVDFSAIITFKVRKNDEANYRNIETITDMHQAFGYTLPSDQLHFLIDLNNNGNKDFKAQVDIRNIHSQFSQGSVVYDEDYIANMLDVYYLKNGLIEILNLVNNEYVVIGTRTVSKNNQTSPVKLFEGTNYEMTLNDYRFSNIVNEVGYLTLLSNYELPIGEKITLRFTIGYNDDTSYPDFQYGVFHLNSIYTLLT